MHGINRDVAAQLRLMGDLLEIVGEESFKVRAYYRAADNLSRLETPVSEMEEAELRNLPGIGVNIARKIVEFTKTGGIRELEEIASSVPPTLVELLDLDGVGPKTVHTLWTRMHIDSIEALESAAKNRRLRALRGFGAKKEQEILRAIGRRRRDTGRMTRLEAESIIARLRPVFSDMSFTIAGSYRRGVSTIGDIDIVTTEPAKRMNSLFRRVADEVLDEGDWRTSLRISGRRVDVRFTEPENAGAMLLYLTGSQQFNIRMREIALERGLKLNEYGVTERENGTIHSFPDEASVFSFLDMAFIPPELREDHGEIELARSHALPALLKEEDVRGDLHMHSSWSDGALSIEQLARLGEERGYDYIACTDHSASLGVAHGLDSKDLRRQQQEIERINRETRCSVLAGVEVDILGDGILALPDAILEDLDLVIASVHSGFKQSEDVMTRRILSAIHNDNVDIIGHPMGRLLGKRMPYAVDLERIIDVAADTETALEINASPYRLDLDDIYVKRAHDHGAILAIGTDAHRREDAAVMRHGIAIARRGWCAKSDVLNTRSLKDLREWLG
jgi:DNA polymerase (family 10)